MGTFELNSQNEINAFAANGCVNIIGSLKISDDHITDISALQTIRTISDFLWITVTSLDSLEGLNNLESVGTYLLIHYNARLKNLSGLQKLKTVGGRISIGANNSLESADSLNLLESAESISISDNMFLKSISSFPHLTYLKSFLKIVGNNELTVSGFNHLAHVTDIEISSIQGEGSISGFNKIDSLTSLKINYINHCPYISGFNALKNVSGYISITENKTLIMLPDFDSLTQVGQLTISNPALRKIPDFPNLTSASQIDIRKNLGIDSLLGFPNLKKVKYLNIADNSELTYISGFNDIRHFQEFTVTNNPKLDILDACLKADTINVLEITGDSALVFLPEFNALSFSDNIYLSNLPAISSIPILPNLKKINTYLRLEKLSIPSIDGFNEIDSIGTIANFSSLRGLYLDELNNLTTITGFNSLDYAHSFRIAGSQLDNLDQFHKINRLEGDLFITGNPSMKSLFALGQVKNINGLVSLTGNKLLSNVEGLDSINVAKLNSLSIIENDSLHACNSKWICESIASGIPVEFGRNANGCVSEFDVRKSCAISYAFINAEVYYDVNQNGLKDEDEPLFPSSRIHILPDDITLLSQQSNPLHHFLDFGEHKVTSYVPDPENWALTSSPDTFNIELTEVEPGNSLYFGYYPVVPVDSMSSYLTSFQNLCNHNNSLRNTVTNHGTTVRSGILWLKLDQHIDEYEFVIAPDHISGEFAGYDFENLFPGRSQTFVVKYHVPGPAEFTIGDSLIFESYVEDRITGDNSIHYYYKPVVLCSFDPNDKQTHPSRADDATLFSEYLHYTVRFQNTGNYPATDITIKDTLDKNLDFNSIALISSRHLSGLTTSLRDSILIFSFSNIYLPDSISDPEGSQGYVDFTIQPIRPIEENTIVDNRASIYFDDNPPILTNTTKNRYVSSLITSHLEPEFPRGLEIYPNPSNGYIYVKWPENTTSTLSVIAMDGRIIMQKILSPENSNRIDLKHLAGGFYIIRISSLTSAYNGKIYLHR